MIGLKLVVLGTLVAALSARDSKEPVQILSEKTFVNINLYNFEYKTSDGVSRKEEGNLITVEDHQGIGVKGSYSYLAANSQFHSITADE